MSGPSDEERDLTSHYEVTGPPTGGPGRWPAEMPEGEIRTMLEQLIRETEEPPSRVALRVVTVLVIIVIILVGSIAWEDLDERITSNEVRIARLEQQVDRLQQESGGG